MKLLKFNAFHNEEQLFICMCHSSESNKKRLMNEKIKVVFNFSVHLFGVFSFTFLAIISYSLFILIQPNKLFHTFKILF